MKLDGREVVITGGAGFIGSWIAETLAKDNIVTVVDNLSGGKAANLMGIRGAVRMIKADVRDAKAVNDALKGAEVVFHEAANVRIPFSIENPKMDMETNIGGTINVLEACRKHDVGRLVFASSSAVYGDTDRIPIIEEESPNPKSPYALSKLSAELYVRMYKEIYGLETVALRYFNVYGPRQNADSPYSGVLSIFARNIAEGRPLTVFGDGEQTRDFVNVRDVARANALAAVSKKASGKAMNVGTGRRISLNEMIMMLEKITGKKLQVVHNEGRTGDVRHSCADATLAEKLIGFKAKFSLEQGLRELLGKG